ncbi:MAG: bifunctional ADP-dependent NAD(P)H-hydrate dehydratase/NAD(P)H-hydrate epimerase, partial [Clostridia bacterium]|nr:bifunctional ADP-dependent NAD(P)H-hydrate dehydratase/NAD(P)H-hydrate epimerase [Clostridia bacterium]
LAQGIPDHDAASLAVYLHGAAGDRLAKERSEYGVLASELPEMMAREMRALELLRDGEDY